MPSRGQKLTAQGWLPGSLPLRHLAFHRAGPGCRSSRSRLPKDVPRAGVLCLVPRVWTIACITITKQLIGFGFLGRRSSPAEEQHRPAFGLTVAGSALKTHAGHSGEGAVPISIPSSPIPRACSWHFQDCPLDVSTKQLFSLPCTRGRLFTPPRERAQQGRGCVFC